jgi:hypothetical protein
LPWAWARWAPIRSATRRELELGLELHPPGLDLGQIQQVIDDVEQVLARGVDARRVLLLGRVFELDLQQLRIAEDAVEGRAQLVGHVGEEVRLELVGLLGPGPAVLGTLEGLLHRVGHAVERAGQLAHLVGGARLQPVGQIARLEAPEPVDHAGDAAGDELGHPDRHDDHQHHHHQRGQGQRAGGLGQVAADVATQGLALLLELLVGFGDRLADALGRGGGGAVKVIHVGADRDEAEAPLRVAVLAGVIGDRRGGGELVQAREEDRKDPEPPLSVSWFQPAHWGEKLR